MYEPSVGTQGKVHQKRKMLGGAAFFRLFLLPFALCMSWSWKSQKFRHFPFSFELVLVAAVEGKVHSILTERIFHIPIHICRGRTHIPDFITHLPGKGTERLYGSFGFVFMRLCCGGCSRSLKAFIVLSRERLRHGGVNLMSHSGKEDHKLAVGDGLNLEQGFFLLFGMEISDSSAAINELLWRGERRKWL